MTLLKQQIQQLLGKGSLAGWRKVLEPALIHLKAHSLHRACCADDRLGAPGEALALRVWKEVAHAVTPEVPAGQ